MDDMEKNKNVKQAMDELKRLSADEHERELAYQRMLRVIDDESIREAGYDAGKKEGKIEIVKNMIKKGIDDKVIIECTEISKEQLEEIKNKK